LAMNLPVALSAQGIAFALMFLVSWLSFRWFFAPAISRHLLLAFATHNPITLVFGGYAAATFLCDPARSLGWLQTALLLVGLWLPVAAWATSRTGRAP